MKNFRNFLRYMSEKEQKWEFCVLSGIICILGSIFYYLYPFPFVFPDSGAYIAAANDNIQNVYRPMGYSNYLQILHSINGHISFVFIASYALNSIASLFLLYSFKYLSNIRNRYLFYILCACVFLSPTILFSTNFIMSDGIFNTLTIVFIATALWLIYTSNIWIILLHLCCLALLYKTRYTGMFYVPISMIALFISAQRNRMIWRLALSCVPVILSLFLQSSAKHEYKRISGVNMASGFEGWQLMNNASVLIPKAKSLPETKFDTQLEQVYHQFLKTCPDSLFTTQKALTTGLMWDKASPFKKFMIYYGRTTRHKYETAWAETGALYSKYARQLIFTFPLSFLTEYAIPSFLSFFEFRKITEDQIEFKNQRYFHQYYGIETDSYKHKHSFFSDLNPVRHIFHYIYWFLLGGSIIYYFFTFQKYRFKEKDRQAAGILLAFITIYIIVSALASPNTTWRYAMPIYIPSVLFMAYMWNIYRHPSEIINRETNAQK